ncbi:M28 family peptidase [Candidatus Bathyarchaeota archaeon]|nr:MAG: M28 family peptidase [Candidatus Bathyarchaeota archaeon]
MIWLSKEDRELLERLLEEISAEELERNWEKIMEFTPMPSGTPQEEAAIQWMKGKLEEYGLEPRVLRYPAYISLPKEAQLTVLSPRRMEIHCSPFRSVASTPPEGVEGELVYIRSDDLGKVECRDKIVLTDQATGEFMGIRDGILLTLQEMGVKGLVVICEDTYMPTVIHQRADFSVSGNPTPDNFHLIPQIKGMVLVSNADGEMLKTLCQHGEVRVRLRSIVETGWKTLPLLVAEIKGRKNPEKFILVNGHVDTPPFSPGVTDNASGDIAMLELARIFNKYKDRLNISLRFAWWTGHEIGRYAGSTWYNDEYWHDLRYNCVASLNIDSPGAEGATVYQGARCTELLDLTKKSIREITGQEVKRIGWPSRAGDGSFWGTGFPHTGITGARPKELYDPFVNYSGGGWWWHSPYATLDRGDVDALVLNIKVYVHFLLHLCNAPVHPMNFTPLAERMLEILRDLQEKADKVRAYFNLDPVLRRAEEFKERAEALERLIGEVMEQYEGAVDKEAFEPIFEELNRCIMWVSRHINLVAHSNAGKTEQMSMEHFGRKPFPGLQPILDLAKLPLPYSGPSPDFLMLRTKLVRERNRVEDGFFLAIREIEETEKRVRAELS